MSKPLAVEVCHALPREQTLLRLEVPAGTTLLEAIAASGILARHPQIDLRSARVGVFGRLRALSDTVAEGDRIEIYRDLLIDPKDQRHQRVERKRVERARERSQPKPKSL